MKKHHPCSELFPMMSGKQLQELADDIGANGLLTPIMLDAAGQIIDGRHRERACEIAGITPKYEVFGGSDEEILKYVLSQNLYRRHLTESHRAMIAAEITTQGSGKKKSGGPIGPLEVTNSDAAKMLNVGTTSVKRAKIVKDKGSDKLKAAVTSGKMKVSSAAKIASKPKEEQDAIVDAGSEPPVRKPAAGKDIDATAAIASSDSAGIPATQADCVPIRRSGSRRMMTPGTAAPAVAEVAPAPQAQNPIANGHAVGASFAELLEIAIAWSHSKRVDFIEKLIATLPSREVQRIRGLSETTLVK